MFLGGIYKTSKSVRLTKRGRPLPSDIFSDFLTLSTSNPSSVPIGSEIGGSQLKAIKMTNYIEIKGDPIEERGELLALIEQLQQSIARIKKSSASMVEMGKPIMCPLTGQPLQFLSEDEMEYEGAGSCVAFEDDIVLIENPFDLNYDDEDSISAFYESDGDDDAQSYFPCPFCYVEIEVPFFCSHLLEEHCFDLKNAVCPLCAANLGMDATAHFIVQHSTSIKRRRQPEKFNSLSGNSAMFGKKSAANTRGNLHDSAADLLLYPFVCNTSIQNYSVHQDEHSNNNVSTISDGNSACDEKDQQEKRQKADFAQQLIASTIFQDPWW